MSRNVETKTAVCGALLTIAAAFAVLAAGCGSGTSNDQNNDTPGVSVATRSSASLGNYLVSGDGRTLYYFGLDLPAAAGHVRRDSPRRGGPGK